MLAVMLLISFLLYIILPVLKLYDAVHKMHRADIRTEWLASQALMASIKPCCLRLCSTNVL